MLLKINEDLSGDGDPVWAQRILDVKQKTTRSNLFLAKKLYGLDTQIGDLPISDAFLDIHLRVFLRSGLVL